MDYQMIPEYETMLFVDVWPSCEDFLMDLNNENEYFINKIPNRLTQDNAETLFYLLFARYGNNPIANYDVTQWKYKIFSIIFQYGPSWQKRLEVQKHLQELDLDDPNSELYVGSTHIANRALNPDTAPSTGSTEELPYINEQGVNKWKRSKVDGLQMLWSMLRSDVTDAFLNEFKRCFKVFVNAEQPLLYGSEE